MIDYLIYFLLRQFSLRHTMIPHRWYIKNLLNIRVDCIIIIIYNENNSKSNVVSVSNYINGEGIFYFSGFDSDSNRMGVSVSGIVDFTIFCA